MSLPIREQILQALATRMGASRRLEGYNDQDLPLTLIEEGDDSATENQYGMTDVTMPVVVVRAIALPGAKDDAWHTAMNTSLADLQVEAFAGGEDLGGLAQSMEYVSGGISPLADGIQGGVLAITLNIRYQYVHGDPYTQE